MTSGPPADSTTDRTAALLAWYREHGRDLPWRETSDPYRILVSEVMLQQTQVDRVAPRYRRFLDRFPTADALAAAPLGKVLAEWNGLGYNVRARRLWEAARVVADQGWPDTPEGLRRLPGVGPYTAAAVASFAFGSPVAAVDTNLRRVLGRWTGRPLDRKGSAEADRLVPAEASADWNQAIMDLASAVCRRRNPRCEDCPVTRWCADRTVTPRPARQGRFAGSRREARGAVIRRLTAVDAATLTDLADAAAMPLERITDAVDSLVGDRLVVTDGPRFRLG